MIADLHAHYPMHLRSRWRRQRASAARAFGVSDGPLSTRIQALVLDLANHLANYRSFFSGPRVKIEHMKEGGVGVVLSVLYRPFDELDLSKAYGSPPGPGYFGHLLEQLEAVQEEVSQKHSADATFVTTRKELDEALEAGRIAMIHCVEGGFHLGAGADEIRRNVATLRERGVAYVTLAHLFWRQIATNAPAIPFLSDEHYDELFPQPQLGLSELGRAAVEAMLDHRILIDVSHMSARSLADVFSALDRKGASDSVPIVATHAACRLGSEHYNLSDDTIAQIERRRGLIGLIFADHQMIDGVRPKRTRKLSESIDVICAHVDHIRSRTGSHEYTAIGSDLDGFIKPTLAGLEDMRRMSRLQAALEARYGADAELITSGNALRVLRSCLP